MKRQIDDSLNTVDLIVAACLFVFLLWWLG